MANLDHPSSLAQVSPPLRSGDALRHLSASPIATTSADCHIVMKVGARCEL
jgi:hypothetical protein